MKLRLLRPKLLMCFFDESGHQCDSETNTIGTAHGIRFLCPVCFQRAGCRSVGVHSIICWSAKAPKHALPGPGRWSLNGTGFHDLTLIGENASDSVSLLSGCKAHFYVRNGEIVTA